MAGSTYVLLLTLGRGLVLMTWNSPNSANQMRLSAPPSIQIMLTLNAFLHEKPGICERLMIGYSISVFSNNDDGIEGLESYMTAVTDGELLDAARAEQASVVCT